MHQIVVIVQVFLFTPRVLMAVVVKILPAVDVFVTVQPASMMEILIISC